MPADVLLRPLVVDFSKIKEESPQRKKSTVLGALNAPDGARILGKDLSNTQVEALRSTYVATGGNVSETARRHEIDPRVVQRLAGRYEWPVYGTESSESNRRQRQVAVFNKLEQRMEEMISSLEIETKDPLDLATSSKRELSKYLEPLASRHSAFKTVYDSWVRMGTILYPEQFAKDPDANNHLAADARSQVRDLALLGGIAGLHRSMEEIVNRVFVAGVPDRGITLEAEVLSIGSGGYEDGA